LKTETFAIKIVVIKNNTLGQIKRAVLAEDCGYMLDQALAQSGAALVEVTVDPNEPLLPPKRIEKYAANMEKALKQGTPGAQQIRHSLGEQPSRTMLQS
jgi:pyruvate dehydrogenase (quinone)